jgi:hypothetical protein
MSEYGLSLEAAQEWPLAWAFAQMQSIHRRHGVELAGPDGSELDLIAELVAEKMSKTKQPVRRRHRSHASHPSDRSDPSAIHH